MKRWTSIVLLVVAGLARAGAVTFTQSPTLSKGVDQKWYVEFTVSNETDVAVSIIDVRDSTVVRHLAAGVLGANAPAPLQSSSLSQRIEWDGKDDLGYLLPAQEAMRARVQAGMSADFERFTGNNPYSFTSGLVGTGGGIAGMVRDPADGSVYVCGNPGAVHQAHWSHSVRYVRQFDKDGNYIKTLFPIPSTLDRSQATGWGVVDYPAGRYTPVFKCTSVPGFTNTLLSAQKSVGGRLMYVNKNGKLVYGQYTSQVAFGRDGSKPDTGVSAPFMRNPKPANGAYQALFGHTMVTVWPGGNDVLVSGLFEGLASSGHLSGFAIDTTLYKDGRVWRVNLATGNVSVFIDIDSCITVEANRIPVLLGGEHYAALHGTAIDSTGRVYVCDRVNKRIGVYDSSANYLGAIPLSCADRVAVAANGTVYATSRSQAATGSKTGFVRLFKFHPFDNGGARVCSTVVATSVATGEAATELIVNEAGGAVRLWVGYDVFSVVIYEDGGTGLTLHRDFNNPAKDQTQGFDRIAVDRRTETVYFTDNWYGIYKIEDWTNPVIRACSTSANKRLRGIDVNISPHGLMYLREGTHYNGPLTRYTLEHLHAPANWTNTGGNKQVPYVFSRFGGGTGEKGFSINTHGTVALMGRGWFDGTHVSFYGDSGSATDTFGVVKVHPIPDRCGGVEFDLKGNLYVGAQTASGFSVPPVYAGDWGWGSSVGTITKFPAGFDSASMTTAAVTGVTGHKVYALDIAPFSREVSGGGCICRSPRFDVDPYGRIFYPNATTGQVSVVDNEGNLILRMGRYGNIDDNGNGTDIPLAWPTGVAASDNFIYVSDFGNNRIGRIAMVYELDNHPEVLVMSANRAARLEALASVNVSPNPFNPEGSLTFTLNAMTRVRVEVFGPNGRFINTLGNDLLGPGKHRFVWNGTERSGKAVSSGTYYLRLNAGQKDRFVKVVLIR